MRMSALWVATLLLCGHLAAATTAPADGPMLYPRAAAASGGLPANSSGIGTAGLIGAIVAATAGGWLLWSRYRGNRQWGARNDRLLSIAETRPLGNRQYLVVAAYGRRRFLLGVCPARIDMLTSLDDDPPRSP